MSHCCRDQYYIRKYGNKKDKKGKTFAEKISNAEKGSIIFKKPDIILKDDNSTDIFNALRKWLSSAL